LLSFLHAFRKLKTRVRVIPGDLHAQLSRPFPYSPGTIPIVVLISGMIGHAYSGNNKPCSWKTIGKRVWREGHRLAIGIVSRDELELLVSNDEVYKIYQRCALLC